MQNPLYEPQLCDLHIFTVLHEMGASYPKRQLMCQKVQVIHSNQNYMVSKCTTILDSIKLILELQPSCLHRGTLSTEQISCLVTTGQAFYLPTQKQVIKKKKKS